MNEIRLSFLRALALTTRLDFLHESPMQHPRNFWIVVVSALQGLAYAILAALFCWLLRSTLLAALLGTAAVLLAHYFLVGLQDAPLPVMIRKAIFPGENPTVDILTNLLLPTLLFLTIHSGIIFWLPTILTLGITAGMEFCGSEKGNGKAMFVQHYPCWLVAAATFFLFIFLPSLGNSDIARVTLLRGLFLVGGLVIIISALKNTPFNNLPLQASCLLGTALANLLALIANAL